MHWWQLSHCRWLRPRRPQRSAARFRFLIVLGLLGLASFLYLAWHADPAWTLTASIVLSIFGGYWGQLGPLGIFPITPDRLLLVAGVAAVLFRAPGARHRGAIRVEPVHWLIGAALAFAVGSALAAGTLFSNSGFFRLFDRFGVAPFVMFTIAPVAFHTEKHRRVFLAALAALGGYLGLTALFETAGPHSLVLPQYILDPNLGFHPGRARGPFLEAEANGIALFFCGVAAAVAAVTWRRHPPIRTLSGSRRDPMHRWLPLHPFARGVARFGGGHRLDAGRLPQVRPLLVPALIGLLVLVVAALALVPGLAATAGQRRTISSRSGTART